MRVGAIDLGTNSTRLLVADVIDGHVDEVERRLRITRLGEGVDERRRLLPVPIARVRNVLSDFRRLVEAAEVQRTLAVATSAVRDAENGEAFLGEIEWSYGFATRLLTGDEEARLTYRGVGAGRELDPRTRFGDVADAAGAYVESLLPELRAPAAIGVAGTVTSLAALDLGLVDYDPNRVHGHLLTVEAVEEQLERLRALPLEARRNVPGLEPE